MEKIILFILVLSFTSIFGQTNERLEDSIHIYWQPNLVLKKQDFRFDGTKEKNAELYCEKIKMCTAAATNINTIIDIPKDEKKRKNLFEKIYIVPVMEKTKSYSFDKDPIGFLREKIVFDIEEWTARYARQQLEKTTSQFERKYGSINTWHKLILNEAATKRRKLIDALTKDFYLEPKENAYQNWRIKVDNLLYELKEYSTRPEDCIRFMQQKPLDDNYEQYIFLGEVHN